MVDGRFSTPSAAKVVVWIVAGVLGVALVWTGVVGILVKGS